MKENIRMRWSFLGACLVLLVMSACSGPGSLCEQIDPSNPPFYCPPTPATGQLVPEATTVTPQTPVTQITTAAAATSVTPTTPVPQITTAAATSVTPPTPVTQITTEIATSVTPPTSDAAITPSLTPVPVDQQAVQVASTVAAQVSENFGVQVNPTGAVGLDAVHVNGTAGEMAAWAAPVTDEHQTYTDRSHLRREVAGVFGIRSPNVHLETVIFFNKANIQYPALPEGRYMIACYTPRPNDCIAVSMQGEEFQIRPGSIEILTIEPVSTPSVEYIQGSIYKCFRIVRRRICIRIF